MHNRRAGSYFLLTVWLPLTMITWAAVARSGGKEVGDLGTVATGRGTAFVARADNLSAFYYNPAGLSKSRGPNLLLLGHAAQLNVAFLRGGSGNHVKLDDSGDITYDIPCTSQDLDSLNCVYDPALDYSNGIAEPRDFSSVSLKEPVGPQLMAVFSWGGIGALEDLALAVGIYTPPGMGSPVFGETSAQRYAVRSGNLILIFPGVAASYAFNRYFQIGAAFYAGFGTFEQNQAIRLSLHPDHIHYNEQSSGDADFQFNIADPFVPSALFGFLSRPLDWLEVGLTVKPPLVIEPEGKVKYKAPSGDMSESELVPGRDAVKMRQTYPWMVRLGTRYIHRLFDVELDFVFEDWSRFTAEYEIDAQVDDRGTIHDFEATGEFVVNYRDTYSVRLGGDVEVWPNTLILRAGAFYQSSAYPKNNETFALDSPFGTEFGLTAGLTWHAASFLDVNVGYMHIFQPTIDVQEGIAQQMGPSTETVDGERNFGNIINNGTYEVSLNIVGASLEGHF